MLRCLVLRRLVKKRRPLLASRRSYVQKGPQHGAVIQGAEDFRKNPAYRDLFRRGRSAPVDVKITRFEDIEAWKVSRTLVRRLRQLSKTPAFLEERDLARQLQRAGISAMANIAEGFDACAPLEFRRFLRIASRSLSEVQSHLYVALDFQLLRAPEFQALYDLGASAKRLIGGFIRYLGNRPKPG